MFWEDETAEQEFYKRILQTQPFKTICGNDFNHSTDKDFSKPMTLNVVGEILHPYFNDQLRDSCLGEIGKACCHMVLEYGNINTETDIDTFIRNVNEANRGYRRFKKRGSLVYEEMYTGKCWCPIINNIELGKDCSVWCDCSKSARRELFQTILKKPVEVELLNSIRCNDSNICQWVINLEPQKTAQHI